MTLYDELKALDPGVADAFALNAFSPELSIFSARRIVDRVTADKDLNLAESKALIHLMKNGKFEAGALEAMAAKVHEKLQEFGKPLTGADLEPVRRALSIRIVADIHFVSPLTSVPYTPEHYLSILRLIEKGRIQVTKVDLGIWPEMIGQDHGFYDLQPNHLYLFSGFTWQQELNTIVHEVTHAIQDWQDKVAVSQYMEADAYLAAAVADYKLKIKPNAYAVGKPERVALEAVTRMLDAGQKLAGRPLFNALTAISTAFVNDPLTGGGANKKPRVERGSTERADLQTELAEVREFFATFAKGLKKAFAAIPARSR